MSMDTPRPTESTPESILEPASPRSNAGAWIEGVVGLVLVLAGVGVGLLFTSIGSRGQTGTVSMEIPPQRAMSLADFDLTDSHGRSVTRADLAGRVVVANFVFTSCGATCLQVSRKVAAVQKRLAGNPGVRFVSITIDPKTDTPTTLAGFARKIGADDPAWLFLTGESNRVTRLLDASFIAGFGASDRDPFQSVLDTTRIGLLDRHGRMRGFFDGLKKGVEVSVETAVNSLLKEE